MRKILKWEHCAKTWYPIDVGLAVQNIKSNGVVECKLNGNKILFNTEEINPEITQEMLFDGEWYVYTWSD